MKRASRYLETPQRVPVAVKGCGSRYDGFCAGVSKTKSKKDLELHTDNTICV